jgi:hypothetical protein
MNEAGIQRGPAYWKIIIVHSKKARWYKTVATRCYYLLVCHDAVSIYVCLTFMNSSVVNHSTYFEKKSFFCQWILYTLKTSFENYINKSSTIWNYSKRWDNFSPFWVAKLFSPFLKIVSFLAILSCEYHRL